jgi:hypothetical protein
VSLWRFLEPCETSPYRSGDGDYPFRSVNLDGLLATFKAELLQKVRQMHHGDVGAPGLGQAWSGRE